MPNRDRKRRDINHLSYLHNFRDNGSSVSRIRASGLLAVSWGSHLFAISRVLELRLSVGCRAIGRTQSRLFDNRRPLDVGRKGAGIVEEVPTVVFESWLRDGRSEAEKKGKVSDRKRWEQLPCSAA